MLNELYQLSNTLERQGLLPQASTHRDVHKLAKSECLYICLDEDGMPGFPQLRDKKDTSRLWVHSKGNHNRFPAIRVQKPLLHESVSAAFDGDAWKKADLERKREILAELDYGRGNPDSDDIQVKNWTLEQMKPVLEKGEDVYLEGLRRLLKRFPRKENADVFYSALRQKIQEGLWNVNESMAEALKKLLVGVYEPKKNQYTSGCICYFDIKELSQVMYAVADPETEKALIRTLLEKQDERQDEVSAGEGHIGISALSGTRMPLVQDKYPNPKFQVIGPAYLYSNNTGASPCLVRYCMEGTKAFPAGKEQVSRMNDALGFLLEDSRKDMTWTSFWGTSGKKPLLLIAWLEDEPKSEAKLAAALGDEGATSVYESMCKDVLKLLRLKLETEPDEPVHLQLFETLDTGRKQIVYSRVMNVEQLYKNIEDWLEAANNIPPIAFLGNWKNKGGKEIHFWQPHCPGMGAISRLMRTQYYSRNMSGVGDIQDKESSLLTEEEIYRLVIPDTYGSKEDTKLIETCMQEILRNCGDLFLDAFRFQTLYEKKHPFSAEAIRRTCSGVAALGILLYKKGIKKEDYMKSKMFLLGRLMKLADCLHKNYCIIARNEETLSRHSKPIPRELIGGSVYHTALQSPGDALKELMDKLKIYQEWAGSFPGSGSGWILSEMNKTFIELGADESKIPLKPTLEEQIELIIAYGSRLPYHKTSMEENTIVDNNEQNKEVNK